MNKRRQIADSNPKNLTHFSGNSMGSSGLGVAGGPAAGGAAAAGINRSPINSNPELRSTKSIIIGAGQPIIVPGQPMNPTMVNQTKPNVNAHIQSTMLSKVNSDAIASVRSSLQSEHVHGASTPATAAMSDNKVTVEEFCPDGGALDKGFLDDLPGGSTNAAAADVRPLDDNGDSDSDSNDNGNPLVAKFHDDPFDDFAKGHSAQTAATVNAQLAHIKSEPKINPLAKNKSKSSPMVPDLSVILTPTSTSKRRSSNSSDDIEIPHILKTKASDSHASDGQSNEEFDWLSDSNQRHSPDGGEDEASLPSIDKTGRNSTLAAISIENDTTKLDRLQLNDDSGDRGGSEGGDAQVAETKEKSKKKKKDKKEKKEKKEKKHGSSGGGGSGDKEKKRSKSKKSSSEDLLSESKERPSHSDRYEAEDDQYEAL